MALRVNSKRCESLDSPGLSGDELPQFGDMPIYPSQLLFRESEHFFFG
jgi:hypothetical protein